MERHNSQSEAICSENSAGSELFGLFWLYWAYIIYVRMETIKVKNCACTRSCSANYNVHIDGSKSKNMLHSINDNQMNGKHTHTKIISPFFCLCHSLTNTDTNTRVIQQSPQQIDIGDATINKQQRWWTTTASIIIQWQQQLNQQT